jgi:hypothetical protein
MNMMALTWVLVTSSNSTVVTMRYYLLIVLLFIAGAIQARGVYQHPDAFLNDVFAGKVPQPEFVWFTGAIRKTATDILQHKPNSLRTRYWLEGKRSAWILEEIGKEKLITTGIVINEGQIEKVKVLVFRESRGWEVKRSAFTQQFINASLTGETNLSKQIDGISGATLSVKAVTKLSRLALYLHQQILKTDDN